jgi:hypothetical protein
LRSRPAHPVRFARVELTTAPAQPTGLIEIALRDQTVVRLNGAVDAGTLRHVLAALRSA